MFSSRRNSTGWCSQHQVSIVGDNIHISSLDTSRVGGREGTKSTFNRSLFNTLVFIPIIKVTCAIEWASHHTCSKRWWNNLYRLVMAICNTWVLHSQSYYTIMISNCSWVQYFKTNSYFESNHNIFIIKVGPTTKLVGPTTKLEWKLSH
jgi:hypothetical protein